MFKNILALIGLAAVLFLSIGYFQKWYVLTWGQGHLNLSVDTDKVGKGIEDGKEALRKALTKPDETPPQEPGLNSFFSPKPAALPQPAPGSSLQLPRNGQ